MNTEQTTLVSSGRRVECGLIADRRQWSGVSRVTVQSNQSPLSLTVRFSQLWSCFASDLGCTSSELGSATKRRRRFACRCPQLHSTACALFSCKLLRRLLHASSAFHVLLLSSPSASSACPTPGVELVSPPPPLVASPAAPVERQQHLARQHARRSTDLQHHRLNRARQSSSRHQPSTSRTRRRSGRRRRRLAATRPLLALRTMSA